MMRRKVLINKQDVQSIIIVKENERVKIKIGPP